MKYDNHSDGEDLKGSGSGILSPEEVDLREIACALRDLPDRRVPNAFTDMVMAKLPTASKRKSAWAKFIDWTRLPRTVTFTPLKIAPVFALAAMIFVLRVLDKPPHNTASVHQEADAKQVISFVFHSPQANSVAVVGSFNEWSPQGNAMRRLENGAWILTLPLNAGRYSYVFLVDGQLLEPDPRAAMGEDDGFGTRNSILIVENKNDTSI